MTADELREEISVEMELMAATVQEVANLLHDVLGREPTVREKTAAAAFLAQYYSGLENIMKRIHRYCDITLPSGELWHVTLFRRYCQPPHATLPALFDDDLAGAIAPYRGFRHVFYHGYSFNLDWARMIEGMEQLGVVHQKVTDSLTDFSQTLPC